MTKRTQTPALKAYEEAMAPAWKAFEEAMGKRP